MSKKIEAEKVQVEIGGKRMPKDFHRGDGVKVDVKRESRKPKSKEVRNG